MVNELRAGWRLSDAILQAGHVGYRNDAIRAVVSWFLDGGWGFTLYNAAHEPTYQHKAIPSAERAMDWAELAHGAPDEYKTLLEVAHGE